MRISNLIKKLQHIRENVGDLNVYKKTLTYPELVEDIFFKESSEYQLEAGYPSKYVLLI